MIENILAIEEKFNQIRTAIFDDVSDITIGEFKDLQDNLFKLEELVNDKKSRVRSLFNRIGLGNVKARLIKELESDKSLAEVVVGIKNSFIERTTDVIKWVDRLDKLQTKTIESIEQLAQLLTESENLQNLSTSENLHKDFLASKIKAEITVRQHNISSIQATIASANQLVKNINTAIPVMSSLLIDSVLTNKTISVIGETAKALLSFKNTITEFNEVNHETLKKTLGDVIDSVNIDAFSTKDLESISKRKVELIAVVKSKIQKKNSETMKFIETSNKAYNEIKQLSSKNEVKFIGEQ